MTFYGADVAQLRALASTFLRGADALEAAHRGLSQQLGQHTSWHGPDAARFRSEWASQSLSHLASSAAALRDAAATLRRNADEQEHASGTDGGASPTTSTPLAAAVCVEQPQRTGVHVRDLLGAVRHSATGSGDGVRIQRITGVDDKERFIVYIDGTGSTGHPFNPFNTNTWYDAAGAMVLRTTSEAYIKEQMRAARIGADSDVLLVGYSQGGIHAQHIARSGEFGTPMVITEGSPEVFGPVGASDILRLEAINDPVSGGVDNMVFGALNQLGAAVVGAPPAQDITFTANNGMGLIGLNPFEVHKSDEAYMRVADAFESSNDPQHVLFRERLSRFQNGTITSDTDG